jgi:hypothetical protein
VKFSKPVGEFQDAFAWSYEDLRGFDLGLIQHAMPIKEGIKPIRKKQIPITHARSNYLKGVGKTLEGWDHLSDQVF